MNKVRKFIGFLDSAAIDITFGEYPRNEWCTTGGSTYSYSPTPMLKLMFLEQEGVL